MSIAARAEAGVSPLRMPTRISGTGNPYRPRHLFDFGEGRFEILLDVRGEGLEGRHVEHVHALGPLASHRVRRHVPLHPLASLRRRPGIQRERVHRARAADGESPESDPTGDRESLASETAGDCGHPGPKQPAPQTTRRHEHASPPALLVESVDADEERREGLPRARRRGDQRVLAAANRRPAVELGLEEPLESSLEPATYGRMERGERPTLVSVSLPTLTPRIARRRPD